MKKHKQIRTITVSLVTLMAMVLMAGCGSTEENAKPDVAGIADKIQEAAEAAKEEADATDAADAEAAVETDEAPAAEDADEQDAKEPAEEGAPDYEALYAPVLKETLDVAKNGYDFEREYDFVSTGLMEKSMYPGDDDLTEAVGYTITDVSGDGIPELLIGTETDEHVTLLYSIHTLVDDKPVFTLDGWARNSYIWLGDGHYENTGSNGAMSTLCGECHLSRDGREIEWDDLYFTDEKEPGVIGYYHNTTGFYDIDASEELDISDDAFWKILEGYEERYEYLPMTPIGQASVD